MLDRVRAFRPQLSVETLLLLCCAFFILICNEMFWQQALQGREWTQPATWLFASAVAVGLMALHFIAFALVLNRWVVKPVMILLLMVTGMATYYMQRYGVFFDSTMVRNVLATDVKESRELMSLAVLPHLLVYGVLPSLLVWRVDLKLTNRGQAIKRRIVIILAALLVAVGAILLVFQDFSALMRNHREMRHLITPGNYIVGLIKVLKADTVKAAGPRLALGKDARLAPAWRQHDKPTLLVVVVGETARAANWGLSGYARQTTPELAALGVLNFSRVESCGTNTEVSVPCLFSPFGRRNYDEDKIRQHESLLNVLDHAGLKVLWRDNQSGCKGVCTGLETEWLDSAKHPKLCDGERCLDEILIDGLDERIRKEKGSLVVVLHQLGNHGPSYYRRYPADMRRFTPTCDTSDLGKCSREAIVNSYDNALLYTDHFLAKTIKQLQAQTSHNAAMLYVSDHGESLGEKGIFLHGLPYAIAPSEQTHVPMVMWASNGFAANRGMDVDCLKRKADEPLSHDYVFSSILGMLQVETKLYEREFDFTASCRK
ncbi:phosphoethanolamine--lipid A transferase [Chitinimonas arctica]|uniref:Phosphoethanolamine--lipid A transferase n=2 Tax=Chitinimonas arctica TaxID=2594795 RepID=A0A516SMP2_9NEIS|nr:phosphoethanolamine--lipid A transferase [Chitinimonas arctica]